jgi:hypothetical protein
VSRVVRIVLLILLLPLVAGFGLCGAFGVVVGINDVSVFLLGLLGLAITVGLVLVCRRLMRKL